jgi:tetratricopeptide (TPR) repeat protein
MTLTWSGIQVDLEAITPEVFTPSLKGSLQSAMISTARRRGRVAYPISGAEAMLEEVAAGHPVIILQNLGLSWYPVWHYAVVVGYDLELGIVLLHSGVISQKRLSQRVFNNTWARLPATATEHNYVSAVLGLEKAQQWLAAIEGYNTALARWPDSLSARMGLGNSYYALGDLVSAEAAFREATIRFPTNGIAYNNLAQVLWERDNRKEALEAARKAVDLGGPLVEEYQRTLRKIQEGKP